ncbi:hypothetical protein Barb7_01386 [Bacteroidales bacterium Barb7]|nr:hypothetical protein Barb7_01386 [Bacteroidales bacterium Barb7]
MRKVCHYGYATLNARLVLNGGTVPVHVHSGALIGHVVLVVQLHERVLMVNPV